MFGDSSLTFRQRQQSIKEGDERQRGRNSDRGAGDEPDQLLGRPLAEDGQEPPAEQPVDDRADQRREDNPFKHSGWWLAAGGWRLAEGFQPTTSNQPPT